MACLFVFLEHSGLDSGRYYLASGDMGVNLFMTLSGYLFGMIYHGGQRPMQWFPFMRDRCFRIYPVWIAFLVLAWAFDPRIDGDAGRVFDASGLAGWLCFTLPKSLRPEQYALWSVRVEFIFYILLPFIMAASSRKIKNLLGLALFVAVLYWLGLAFELNKAIYVHGYFTMAGHFFQFLSGLIAACLCVRLSEMRSESNVPISGWKAFSLVLAGAIPLTLTWIAWRLAPFHHKAQEAVGCVFILCWGPFIGILLAGCWTMRNRAKTLLKPLILFGTISYSFYIFHPITLQLPEHLHVFFHLRGHGFFGNRWIWAGIFQFLPTVFLATLSYHFVEKPFIELGRRLRRKEINLSGWRAD